MPFKRLLCLVAVILLAACAKDDKPYVERPVDELYNEAMDRLKNDSFEAAGKGFDEVERQHPYSVWATKAQLMAAYAYYEASKYDDAIIAIERFVQLHPGSPDVGYAYYLKALSYYEQITDVARDQKMTQLALKSLQEVADRFPNTAYARDAKLKLDLTRDHLAGKEMNIGRYYLKSGQYLAAINRFRTVVDKFQTTSHVPEALHRLVECYTALGLVDEAKKSASVLGHNYPGSPWYEDSFSFVQSGEPASRDEEKGWLGKIWPW